MLRHYFFMVVQPVNSLLITQRLSEFYKNNFVHLLLFVHVLRKVIFNSHILDALELSF